MADRTESDLVWVSFGLSFAQRLRWLRKRRGLSQEALGHLTGIHRNQISNLERNVSRDDGCNDPKLSTVYKLARALDVAPALLLPASGDRVPRRIDVAFSQVELELEAGLG